MQGVTAIAPITWFGGRYIDDRPDHFFAQLATDPDEYLKVASDKIIPPEQLKAWQQDRAGAHRRCHAGEQIWMEDRRPRHAAGEYFPGESGSDDSRNLSPRSAAECAVFQREIS